MPANKNINKLKTYLLKTLFLLMRVFSIVLTDHILGGVKRQCFKCFNLVKVKPSQHLSL